MSLVKKHEMTEKKLAANRRNQQLCNAPVPDERRERIRAALRRFGYNVPAEGCEAQRKALLRESLDGPSPYEFAAEIAPSHADDLLMRRAQDANLREARRLINLLLKIKRYERQMQALEKTVPLHDVSETNGFSILESECPKALSHSNEDS